jgi:hypothetical protein
MLSLIILSCSLFKSLEESVYSVGNGKAKAVCVYMRRIAHSAVFIF